MNENRHLEGRTAELGYKEMILKASGRKDKVTHKALKIKVTL